MRARRENNSGISIFLILPEVVCREVGGLQLKNLPFTTKAPLCPLIGRPPFSHANLPTTFATARILCHCLHSIVLAASSSETTKTSRMHKMGKQNVIVALLGCCVFCGLYYSQQNIHCSSPMSKKDESAEQYSTPFLSPTPTSRRKGPLPYKCGIVWFYHIPSTGGSSINRWLRKYQKPANGNITYYQVSWSAISLRCNLTRSMSHVLRLILSHSLGRSPSQVESSCQIPRCTRKNITKEWRHTFKT